MDYWSPYGFAHEGEEIEVGEAIGEGEGELDYYVISTMRGAQERMKREAIGTKTPRRRKRDQETIAYLASDWSTHIYLRQDRKLLSSSSIWERLRVTMAC
ncbi:hypothetical protein B296_00023289 [Ensete ventricosum]|uniref:Uncharacterized protein n=1 Tax=Ensete ventricosum TaxID=4639 RepID=A0A427A6T3_ENSVE|nr:hypothetical protein B296_00023289 [Ensete ventricosum]